MDRFESPVRTFTVDSNAVSQHRRVEIQTPTGTIDHAAADERGIGTVERDEAANGNVGVLLDTAPGTRLLVASAAISIGDKLEGAAAGKVATLNVGTAIGYMALTAAAGDGDLIEAARMM